MSTPFTVLRVQPDRMRGESVNIGLVVFLPGGAVMARVEADMARLRALDANLPRLPILQDLAQDIEARISALPTRDMQQLMLRDFYAPVRADEHLGSLEADTPEALEEHIEGMMNRLVRKPALTVRESAQRPRKPSKLDSQMKAWFKGAKLLGRHMDDLARHRIVESYPVAVDADAYADFAFKNGALHVIETLDLRGADHLTPGLRNTAAFKGVVLDMARDVVGEGKRIGVVAAADYATMKGAVRLFERNADELFSLDSPADRQRLADLLARGLHLGTALAPIELHA